MRAVANVRTSDDAHDAIKAFAHGHAVTITAFLEAFARRLDHPSMQRILGEIVEEARGIMPRSWQGD